MHTQTRMSALNDLQKTLRSIEEILDGEVDLTDDEVLLCLAELAACRRYLESLCPHPYENNGGLNAAFELACHVH